MMEMGRPHHLEAGEERADLKGGPGEERGDLRGMGGAPHSCLKHDTRRCSVARRVERGAHHVFVERVACHLIRVNTARIRRSLLDCLICAIFTARTRQSRPDAGRAFHVVVHTIV